MSLIVEMLQNSCRQYAGKAALRYKQGGHWIEYSYGQIWESSDRVAAGCSAWGLGAGDRVALLAPSSPAWVIAYLGALKSNAIVVPVDKDLKQGELRHILSDSGARLLFTEQAFLDTLNDMADSLPALEKVIVINGPAASSDAQPAHIEQALAALAGEWKRISQAYRIDTADMQKFEGLAEHLQKLLMPATVHGGTAKSPFFANLWRSRRAENRPFDVETLEVFQKTSPPPPLQRHAQDPAVILYTSGTTGRAKGAMLSHANIASNVRSAVELFALEPSMHTLSFLPINHVFEQVAGIILPLAVGGTVSFAESLRKLAENLGEVRPNFLLGVPAVFRLLADRMQRKVEDRRLSKVLFAFKPTRPLVTRKVREAFGGNPVFISGGAALDPVVANRLMELGLNVYQGYGITETSPVIAVETPRVKRLGTVGRAIPGVEVKIHQANAEGVGEIWVKGPNVMLGYYNNREATREVLTDGWYHTGDLGSMDADGLLTICGRVKNLIVTANGKNVYPEEIENEMLNSPFIAEIMVYGHKLDATAEEVYAMIYPDHDALDLYAAENGSGSLEPSEIEGLIRREILERGKKLADYKRIRRFTLREDEFPKTTTRKIKRFVVEADIDAQE